ncbi:MAG: phosphoribosylaminoimidazolesuccinocarboxamide synthase [Pseudomonadota bacterium]
MANKRKRQKLFEGKTKIIFEGQDPSTLVQYFKDNTTAANNKKNEIIAGKGIINNRISAYLMEILETMGFKTHFIKTLNMREQLIKNVEILPIEVIIRNVAAGNYCKRFGIEEGNVFDIPLVEYCYKNDELGDPFVSEENILHAKWLNAYEIEDIRDFALRVNDFLSGLFIGIGIKLVDFKLEFGRLMNDNGYTIILADEISPDSCRLWDIKTSQKMDKDLFRFDLGDIKEAYSEVAKRLGVLEGEITE